MARLGPASYEHKRIRCHAVRVQPIDEDGRPSGDPITLNIERLTGKMLLVESWTVRQPTTG